MHTRYRSIGILSAVTALVAGNVAGQVEYKIHTSYASEYMWRGLDLGNNLIEGGLDVSGEWQGIGLSGGVWYGDFETVGKRMDELDLYGEVSKDFGIIKGSIGYIAYLYPDSSNETYQEVSFGISRDMGFATAALKYYWGVEGDNNGYTEIGLSRSYEFNAWLGLNVESNVGYQIEAGQATAWTTKMSLDVGIAEHVKISPFVGVSLALSDDVDTAYFRSGNEMVGGVMLSVTY
ncbi:MAG: hypothetical protein RLZZ282_1598 [Verrucomicrobiota bacterium]